MGLWNEALLARLGLVAKTLTVPGGTCLFGPGDAGETFLIATSGSIRVEQTSPSGRSVVLYRVGAGDSCVMTTSCMLSGTPYSAYGYTEGPVTALAIGPAKFDELLGSDADFRSAVFAAFTTRLVELTEVIDDLLLNRMDQRLAHWLVDQKSPRITATHQQVATELGSAREVMSRILKDFERRGWVTLERGVIKVENSTALKAHRKNDLM